MVGVRNINISQREFNYYKEWVETTQGKSVEEYIGILMKNKLEELKKEKGRCNQRSIILEKGKYIGSCTWKEESGHYKIYLRGNGVNIYYGFFESLYMAENELKRLFKNNEEEIIKIAKKQQEYYQKQHQQKIKPKVSDETFCIKAIHNKNGAKVLKFKKPFINPKTNKQQTQIVFSKNLLKYYKIKQIMEECKEVDDPIKILEYRGELEKRMNQALK